MLKQQKERLLSIFEAMTEEQRCIYMDIGERWVYQPPKKKNNQEKPKLQLISDRTLPFELSSPALTNRSN